LTGKVKVNNKILIECGTKVTSGDIIEGKWATITK
jgi:hypothetical protein